MQWIRACSGVVQGSDVQCCAADGIVSLYLCCTAGVTMTCTGGVMQWSTCSGAHAVECSDAVIQWSDAVM
jgi:hypothetical protein